MATLDDLVASLNRIADYLEQSSLLDQGAVKARMKMDDLLFTKQIMDMKGLNETDAAALLDTWKKTP